MNAVEMVEILGDRYSVIILTATNRKPQTVLELSARYGIPVAVCYRRVKILLKHGFMMRDERILTQEGRRIWRYLSNVNLLNIYFGDGKLMARCELRNGYINRCDGGELLGSVTT